MLVNNAGIYEGVADDASDEEWHAAWARTLAINLAEPGRPLPPRRPAISAPTAAAGSSMSPAAPPFAAIAPATGIMPRPKSALIGMTKTIARGYAAENILAFAVAPGFTVSEMTEEYLPGPRRSGRSSPTSRSAG